MAGLVSTHQQVSTKMSPSKRKEKNNNNDQYIFTITSPSMEEAMILKNVLKTKKKIKLSWHQDRDSYSLEPSQQTIRQYMTCRRTDDCPDERNVEEVFLRLFHHIQMTSSEAIPSLISIEFYSSGVLCTYESCGKNFTAAVVVVIDSY